MAKGLMAEGLMAKGLMATGFMARASWFCSRRRFSFEKVVKPLVLITF